MGKYNEIYGVDISKDVFDVAGSTGFYKQYPNTQKGFGEFVRDMKGPALVVMEATGYYHYCLAQYLYDLERPVSVVNPLSVKRFVQMRLSKVKTDKSDAMAICEYAVQNEVPLYTGRDGNQAECLQLLRLLELYIKQRTQLKNKVHGEEALGIPSSAVYRSLVRSRKALDKEIALLEGRLLSMVKQEHRQQLTNLKSIPGLGDKTAALLIVLTDGFTKFETASQLCSFAGTTPTIRRSGSSVRGKSRISKMGNQKLRNLLFLCAFSACKYNRACRDVYERIVAQGKSKKLALMAVVNKLIKQAFAIAKSGLPYNENYSSRLN